MFLSFTSENIQEFKWHLNSQDTEATLSSYTFGSGGGGGRTHPKDPYCALPSKYICSTEPVSPPEAGEPAPPFQQEKETEYKSMGIRA